MLLSPTTIAPAMISPTMVTGFGQPILGQHQPGSRDFVRVLLGEVTRSLQQTSGLFSGKQSQALFDNPLAGHLFGQILAEKLTEQLVGRLPPSMPERRRPDPAPEKTAPTPDNPPFDPFFAPLPESATQLARQEDKSARFVPFLYHDRL